MGGTNGGTLFFSRLQMTLQTPARLYGTRGIGMVAMQNSRKDKKNRFLTYEMGVTLHTLPGVCVCMRGMVTVCTQPNIQRQVPAL